MGGGFISFENSKKIDIIRVSNNFFTHKQIENRNGLLFMRMKKRAILTDKIY